MTIILWWLAEVALCICIAMLRERETPTRRW